MLTRVPVTLVRAGATSRSVPGPSSSNQRRRRASPCRRGGPRPRRPAPRRRAGAAGARKIVKASVPSSGVWRCQWLRRSCSFSPPLSGSPAGPRAVPAGVGRPRRVALPACCGSSARCTSTWRRGWSTCSTATSTTAGCSSSATIRGSCRWPGGYEVLPGRAAAAGQRAPRDMSLVGPGRRCRRRSRATPANHRRLMVKPGSQGFDSSAGAATCRGRHGAAGPAVRRELVAGTVVRDSGVH
jgi:hypothetical protein